MSLLISCSSAPMTNTASHSSPCARRAYIVGPGRRQEGVRCEDGGGLRHGARAPQQCEEREGTDAVAAAEAAAARLALVAREEHDRVVVGALLRFNHAHQLRSVGGTDHRRALSLDVVAREAWAGGWRGESCCLRSSGGDGGGARLRVREEVPDPGNANGGVLALVRAAPRPDRRTDRETAPSAAAFPRSRIAPSPSSEPPPSTGRPRRATHHWSENRSAASMRVLTNPRDGPSSSSPWPPPRRALPRSARPFSRAFLSMSSARPVRCGGGGGKRGRGEGERRR